MADETSKAQQDKESRVKKIEEDLKNEYEKIFKEHQDAAEKAREDQPDQAETEEEYHARIHAVTGGHADPEAFNPASTASPEEQAQVRPAVTNVDAEDAENDENKDDASDKKEPNTPSNPAGDASVADKVHAKGNVPGTGTPTE